MRIRIVAPLGTRIERLSVNERLPVAEARAQIEKFDAEREAFARTWFQRESNSPLNYDLVLNTAELSLEAAADIAIGALENKLGVNLPKPTILAA
jgi:cytidylate kinase